VTTRTRVEPPDRSQTIERPPAVLELTGVGVAGDEDSLGLVDHGHDPVEVSGRRLPSPSSASAVCGSLVDALIDDSLPLNKERARGPLVSDLVLLRWFGFAGVYASRVAPPAHEVVPWT
jgi:hypothetical protein